MAKHDDRSGNLVCSFCGKSQDQVRRLIAGPGAVYICDECVDLCREIIEEEEVPRAGRIVQRAFQRARWHDGKTYLWIGRRSETGRGEGSHLRALFGDVDLHTLLRLATMFGLDDATLVRAYDHARKTAAAANAEMDEYSATYGF